MRHREFGIVLGVLVGLLILGILFSGALLGPGMTWGMGPGMMGGYGGGNPTGAPGGWTGGVRMVFGLLAMLAFWGALIVGSVWLVRGVWGVPRGSGPGPAEDPQTILRRRYAAGEIDQATYERMRRELDG